VLFIVFVGTSAAALIEAWHLDEPQWTEDHSALIIFLTFVAIAVSGLAALGWLWSAGRAYDKAKSATVEALTERQDAPGLSSA
jgi:hypothetical protein